MAVAIASNHRDIPLDPDCVVMGEVGLGGEIRSINHIESRLKESQRLGFKRAIIPKGNVSAILSRIDIELISVSFVKEALDVVFKRR